jgi:hypothetical protein
LPHLLFTDSVIGKEDGLVDLKTALKKLFTEIPPKVNEIKFKNKDGGELYFPNSQGRYNGPKAVWKMNQQDKLNIARMWLAQYTSDKKNSFTFIYNGSSPLTPLLKQAQHQLRFKKTHLKKIRRKLLQYKHSNICRYWRQRQSCN